MAAIDVLTTYFTETMAGDMTAVDRCFVEAPDYVLIAEDAPELAAVVPWVGRQRDRDGIKRAYGMLLDALEVVEARPGAVVEQDGRVAIDGVFRYRVRSTGRTADSAWPVHARVQDGRISEYRFYENVYAVARALEPSATG